MVNFDPTPEQQAFIDAQLRTGRFRDAGEVLRAGLRLWMKLERSEKQRYEAWLGPGGSLLYGSTLVMRTP